MKIFLTFCKKEVIENLRTFRLVIMFAVFILIGIMNPMVAKMLPEILNGTDLGGITIQMDEPVAMDSWAQFFSNVSQIGVLVLAIVFCGITANELSKGTLINILTKGMKRSTVILSKFSITSLIWTISYALCFVVTLVYNNYFWGSDPLPHACLAFLSPWVFGLLLISLMILGGICLKNIIGSLAFAGGAVIIMGLLNLAPALQKYNPISLSADTLNLINGTSKPEDFIPALIICLLITLAAIVDSILIFGRKQL